MSADEPPVYLRRPLERLVRAFAPTTVLVFGSHAKGTARPGSDVDLLVVADLDGDRTLHLRRARQLVAPCFPPVDVVFATPDEVADAPNAASPFLASVLESGVVVYSANLNSNAGATTAASPRPEC